MRIAHITDTHLGITKIQAITRMLDELVTNEFDLLLHTGDYSGGAIGHKTLTATVKRIRNRYKGPFITVIGNHDYWVRGKLKRDDALEFCGYKSWHRPSLDQFLDNYNRIKQTFKENDVHFLDEDGPYRVNGYVLTGHSGWYNFPEPPTNDIKYLPMSVEGDTHKWMLRRAFDGVYRNLEGIDPEETVVFVSHFPVIKPESDIHFDKFSWSEVLGDHIRDTYKCRYFFNGHAHQLHEGPLRYEPGSDYYNPKFKVVEI